MLKDAFSQGAAYMIFLMLLHLCRLGTTSIPGPSCSKLTMLLVNNLLKFTSSDYKCAKCTAKATHIFSAKNIRILYVESAKTVNEMTLNELVKLTML